MKQNATITSKGQITIPVEVRRSLGLQQGDRVVFEINEGKAGRVARIRRAPDFISMAGAIPPRKRLPRSWSEERRIAIDEAVRREG
jgi:AbrB family looped-hinge helix DNA binding protein